MGYNHVVDESSLPRREVVPAEAVQKSLQAGRISVRAVVPLLQAVQTVLLTSRSQEDHSCQTIRFVECLEVVEGLLRSTCQ